MAYLLDANVFIQAKNLHYGMDFCPGFWDWLLESSRAGIVASVTAVDDELQAGSDQLARWSARQGSRLFLDLDASAISAARQVSLWVTGQPFKTSAIDKFIDSADHILIAVALAKQMKLVTHEKRSNTRKTVKIPDVCNKFAIECISPFEMLRRENARFVLGTTA